MWIEIDSKPKRRELEMIKTMYQQENSLIDYMTI